MSDQQTTQAWNNAAASIEVQINALEDQFDLAENQKLENSAQVIQLRRQLNSLPLGSAERAALNQQIIQLDDTNQQLTATQAQLTTQISSLSFSLTNATQQAASSSTGVPNTSVVPPPGGVSSTAETTQQVTIQPAVADPQVTQTSIPQSIESQFPADTEDPFEARRLEIEQELDNPPPTLTAEDVGGELDAGAQAQLEFQQEQNRTLLEVENFQPEPVAFAPGLSDEELLARQNPGGLSDEEIIARRQAAEQAAAKANALNQATLQSRYKQPGNTDWRVRLSLASSSSYLYNVLAAGSGDQGAGILAPLAQSNGVIFPYMPQISTLYRANYAQYDLVHSNFRGVYYQSSRVDDIQIRGTFTAQDTTEAAYLLAVIHFFRSVTKMFYGKDAERGTPPPLVYLSGLGDYQFSKHPCLVSQFSYTLPNDVDYIRATNPNDYGGNLLSRRTPTQTAPGGINFAGARRLANTLTPSGQPLPFGATPQTPQQNSVTGRVNNTGDFSTYVPTMMEIDITLIPVQTRSQVSKQFSLKDFANGNLLRGGFW
jgi:hypothetical protein